MAQNFRVTELTGTNFWSYVKADLLVIPLCFVLSFAFWAFIWHAGQIPSESFPWAQKLWNLEAKNTLLTWSATMPGQSGTPLFFQALHPAVLGGAFALTLCAFTALSAFGLPTMAVYGFIWGIGGMPHGFIAIIVGALVGKYYFQRRFGETKFLQMAPVLVAGYGTGVGLIALIGVALTLIQKAISAAPF
jgi:hypothetical protein